MIRKFPQQNLIKNSTTNNNTQWQYWLLLICCLFNFTNVFATTYGSSTVAQVTNPTTAGATNQAIIRIAVVGGGGGAAFPVCSMSFAMNNSVVPLNARLFYTGTSAVFATGTQLGATVPNPTGTISFTFNQTHGAGTFYYWLAYDIPTDAPNCATFDAAVSANGVTYSGAGGGCPGVSSATPTVSNPDGDRQIEVPGCWKYCASGGSNGAAGFLSNVSLNTINRNSSFDGYINTGITTTLLTGSSYTLSVSKTTITTTTFTQAWIDWNNDGDFLDAGEIVLASASSTASGTRTVTVNVPLTATLGVTRMRVMMKQASAINAGGCDTSNIYTDTEEYFINIINPPPCESFLQPSNLFLTAGNTFINGAFAYPTPQAENYLVVVSTSATPPTPTNGVSYTIGSTISPGYTVVDTDGNNSFTATGLLPLTTYYFYIFSYDTNCIGGPLYNNVNPLTDSATTNNIVSPAYCTPVSSTGIHINRIEGVGSFANEVNGPTGYTAPGYSNYTNINIATQLSGGGVNIDITLAGTSSFGPPPCTSSSQLIGAFVDWNNDGDFLDANEKVYESTAGTGGQNIFGFVIPNGTPEGIYRLRIRTKSLCLGLGIDPCTNYGGGETEDYSISVIENCAAQITSTIDGDICGIGSTVTLTAFGTPGTIEYRWYTTAFGGTLVGTSSTNTWVTPPLSISQTFYVTAFNGTCESLYRTAVQAFVYDTTDINFTPNTPTVCGDEITAVTAYATQNIQNLFYEGFDSGTYGQMILSTPLNLWDSNGNGITNEGDFPEPRAPWLIQSTPWIPDGTSVFVPAISSGNVGNHYAVAISDYRGQEIDTRLTTPAMDATGYSTLTLSFRQYYSDFNNTDFAYVEVSTDGGTVWNSIATYTSDRGNPGVFNEEIINLNAYINVTDLRVRFRYRSGWCDGWAIDDIRLYGLKPFVSTFTWSGAGIDAYYQLPAIPANLYSGQAVETIYFLPNGSQIETEDWTFDVTATLPSGCTAQVPVTIGNNTKTWKGTINSDWFEASNWAPLGVPTINTCIVVPDLTLTNNNPSEINGSGNDGFGKNMLVRAGGQFVLNSVNTLTIKEEITVESAGYFKINDSSSLIQIDNLSNSGNIIMDRNTNIRMLDYVYWSSPVAGFAASAISPLSPTSLIWKWLPTNPGNTNGFGNWISGNETMAIGRGYIVRGPSGYTTTHQIYTATFTGVPNNGDINTPISRGSYSGANYTGPTATPVTENDDNWNLVGNPYPSAINAISFLNENTNIAGFVKLWTHGTLPSSAIADPFYQDYGSNYTVADYITYNASGSTDGPGYLGNIGAGQSFFVLMNHTSASTTENIAFNNSMRGNTLNNSQFFRNSNELSENSFENIERNRIWLDLYNANGNSSRTLIGYIEGATNSEDRLFDAPSLKGKSSFELYSLADNKEFSIQGRELPFDSNDVVKLGIIIPNTNTYTIGIGIVDGLFLDMSQNIYLRDNLLNTIHDLRSSPYSFSSTSGKDESRFELIFENETLGNEDFISTNGVTVYTNNTINVTASSIIKSVTVYDVLGRTLGTVGNVNNTDVSLNGVAKTQSALIVIVELENGVKTTQKVIF